MSGAEDVSCTVPDATNDAVAKLSMAFRVTDAGEPEVVRTRRPTHSHRRREYVEGESEDVQVLARWGHERSSSIMGVLRVPTLRALESVSRVLAAVANTETTTSELIGPPGTAAGRHHSHGHSLHWPPPYSGYASHQRASP
jgi:hypothetical protein